jgi:hypothetical protein
MQHCKEHSMLTQRHALFGCSIRPWLSATALASAYVYSHVPTRNGMDRQITAKAFKLRAVPMWGNSMSLVVEWSSQAQHKHVAERG